MLLKRLILFISIFFLFIACSKESTAPTAINPPPPPTPPITNATLWEKYKFTKPANASEIINSSTNQFKSYVATNRSPNQVIKIIAQTGVDPMLINWIDKGANFVAKAFTYPTTSRQFVDVIGIDRTWFEAAYKTEGFSQMEINDRLGGWDNGAPAFGGSYSNSWNYSVILKNNALVNNKIGLSHTPGHEFFHAIQERFAKATPGPNGEKIPNWFWEGPAMFIGLQTSSILGFSDYAVDGQKTVVTRYSTGSQEKRAQDLKDVKANNSNVDPYAIGEVATELLIAMIGVEKFLNIYAELGKGLSFDLAFKNATDIELVDFYSMFEEVRAVLNIPKA